jgi:enamine deaminase RidA (YjgF/YER057c/UK114 family)
MREAGQFRTGDIATGGGLVFTRGFGHRSGDIKNQVKEALEDMERALKTKGFFLEDVVKVNVMLRDIEEFPAMNEIYGEIMGMNPPARTTCEVARLPEAGQRVQFSAIASKSRRTFGKTSKAPSRELPFTGGVISGDLFFLSGAVPNEDGKGNVTHPYDIKRQTGQAPQHC